MNKRMYKVYTLWEFAIPQNKLQSSSIYGKNLYVHWNGILKPVRRTVKYVDSFEKASLLRRALIPSKDKILAFQKIIQQVDKGEVDYDSVVILSMSLLMEIYMDDGLLIIRTRQHPKPFPSIYKTEKKNHTKEYSFATPQNINVNWDYVSPLIRRTDSCYQVFCPLCHVWFAGSHYLSTVFEDERSLWLANMVTHYRHSHIKSWDKMWGRYGGYYQQAAHYRDEDYEDRKSDINERAKRQIARKSLNFLIDNMIEIDVFKSLQGTTEDTIKTVSKLFDKKQTINRPFLKLSMPVMG